MPTVKKPKPTEEHKFDEFERLTRWRFQALLALGLAPDQAMGLVETADVVHAARRLADKGCPPGIIAFLLEGD